MPEAMTRYIFTINFEEPYTEDDRQLAAQRDAITTAARRIETLITSDPEIQRILAGHNITQHFSLSP